MSKYRNRLPQLKDQLFMTDGGLETTLIFHDGIELPLFAAFDLLKGSEGTAVLYRYFARYAAMARSHGLGLVLEAPTWRANADWAEKLGYDATTLTDANRKAISLLLNVREEYETADTRIVISGNLGPCGDGYRPDARMSARVGNPLGAASSARPDARMSAREAQDYHATQIGTFVRTDAELDESTDLDAGDAEELGMQYAQLRETLPRLSVVGGCCGTDHRHVDAICRSMGGMGKVAGALTEDMQVGTKIFR